ncbi:uncharacterized protein BP5553_03284 [Venustampulla echinocandica]|uniref:non-specific serine/threonine protein kinase n=1 Tax=Venustampulla echinocandica TaxID=2656787 RepID=A0A370TTV7_9HELO|nr:uncharacterized protein BP5553_03284 [Venustampulla echinocandica]RDL38944.1 hypothetical protein BP5553_03284 [Venustampulla echinocandica]
MSDIAAMENAKQACPELQSLPQGWSFNLDNANRVYFIKAQETTYNHPALGGLPKPWILMLIYGEEFRSFRYYNRETKEQTSRDPRYMDQTLQYQSKAAPRELWIAASSQRNNNIDLATMQRSPIENHDIRDKYERIHTIDPGDGTVGGMNGGVYVVRIKNIPNKLYIEKRFKSEGVSFGKKEIKMLRQVKHSALTSYSAAFLIETSTLKDASVYIEFCDRGSLKDLIGDYFKRGNINPKPRPPEPFVWHVFGGLLDALAYLQTGSSLLHRRNVLMDKSWTPIIHRDFKPDNVLLRSRATVGSTKYFYCVLSDFGLACEDRPYWHPDADHHQKTGGILGTYIYFAPELCYESYPRTSLEKTTFPNGYRHSGKSDIWALGVCIYNLCACRDEAGTDHLDGASRPPLVSWNEWGGGQICRRNRYPLPVPPVYSPELREAILRATEWYPDRRPDAATLLRRFEELQEASGCTYQGGAHALPDWATRKHEYFSKAEQLSKGRGR